MCGLCDNLCDKGDCMWQKSEITMSFLLILSDSNPNGWYHYKIEKLADLKINKLEMENNWCE